MDIEFDKVVEKMPSVEINTAAALEHVGGIERWVRFVEERCVGTH